MGIPNYRERSRLNYLLELIKEDQKFKKRICHVHVLYFLTNEKNFPKIKSQWELGYDLLTDLPRIVIPCDFPPSSSKLKRNILPLLTK